MKEKRITFLRFDGDVSEIEINGKPAGGIYREEKNPCGRRADHTVIGYDVDIEDEEGRRIFRRRVDVRNHASARAALTAAKNLARDFLLARADETETENP
jgi:hypothetical protein